MITARFADLIRRNRRELIFTAFWTAIVSTVVIISYYSIYLTSVWGYWRTAFSVSPWEGPSIGIAGIIVLIVTSIVAGYVISDSRSLISSYSFMAIISYAVSVAFSFSYLWFALGYQTSSTISGFVWEYYLYFAVVTIFRMFFPAALFTSLFGVALGSIVRVYLLGR
jgi:hypothetical protein